jgi:hypothetical protein
MFNKALILFIIITFYEITGQITNPLRFPHQDYDSSCTKSSVLGLSNGDLLFFWVDGEKLF